MDDVGGWIDKFLYLALDEEQPDGGHLLGIETIKMSELLSADLPVNRVLDFPPRLLPRYQRVLPVAKLEHLADHAVIDSPGCCLIGTKIVFVNGGECFEFETNTMLEHSRVLRPSQIMDPFGHNKPPRPFLIKGLCGEVYAVDTSPPVHHPERFLEVWRRPLQAQPAQELWTPLPRPPSSLEPARFRLSCAVVDTNIIVSTAWWETIYRFDVARQQQEQEQGWLPCFRPKNVWNPPSHLPWEKRALISTHRGYYLAFGYSSERPWQISVHKVSLRDDELRLLRTKQIVQPELYPAPTDFVFARVEQRKFCLVLAHRMDNNTILTLLSYEIQLATRNEDVDIVMLGSRQFTVRATPSLLGAFVL